MMKTEGVMPEDYKLVGRILDISSVAARNLIVKLKELGFLIATDTGNKFFTLSSPRLSIEYEKSKGHCNELSRVAKLRADKRWGNSDVPIE